ncbi:GAF domain-containing protein [filamentous cyanobacterium LEGE 11480]|uniref:GAF domain-containing protein n=1 Tax=Romeriopsis navalis LEGE 11480 TaxID=2777977 RepID=A0A928VLT2_9CYAN|nr:methyl-accepting chemotaxis protein [Romeriopsis navalis]MBE9029982.1 GAF domain-containing protein [Romeriopsis navalis LEGE 11480]
MMSPNDNQPEMNPQDAALDAAAPTELDPQLVGKFAETATAEATVVEPPLDTPTRIAPKLNLRTKATILAVLLGTVPIATVGGIGFLAANNTLDKQINQQHKAETDELIDKVNRFIFERYGDIQIIAQQSVFAEPAKGDAAAKSKVKKQAVLETFKKTYGVYDSIAFFDTRGNVLAQTSGDKLKNHADRAYFQEVIKTGEPVVGQPMQSKSSGKWSVHFAAPVINPNTKQVVGVVRSRLPITTLKTITLTFNKDYQFFNEDGTIFLSNGDKLPASKIQEIFATIPKPSAMQSTAPTIARANNDSRDKLLGYATTRPLQSMPNLNWGVAYTEDKDKAFQAVIDLASALGLGTIATGVIVSTIAIALVSRTTKSLQAATDAVEKIGQGDLDTRLEVDRQDEFGRLGENINEMVEQLQVVLAKQAQQAKYAQIVNQIVSELRGSLKREDILTTATTSLLQHLETDRVVVYNFHDDFNGTVIAEAVKPEYRPILHEVVQDPFREGLIEEYRQGRVRAMNDIVAENLTQCHAELLAAFQIRASVVAPLMQEGELVGLLCAHECGGPRQWQTEEVEMFSQVAIQVGYALEQAHLLNYAETARLEARQEADARTQEQKDQKEMLQRRALELLMEVDPVSQGDLTIRAKVTPDEMGTIADSYNSIIRSLRQLVVDVQGATETVAQTASSNESSVQQLSEEARQQMTAITAALLQVQETVESVKGVTTRAVEAEQGVKLAAAAIADGDIAMNKTVEGISTIRETVSETAKKVKRLGEASQKISKVVNLINGFAAQTNLLALNAAIEAARAGEEGRGFAVVAEEVRSLAQQSSSATEEIEQLVEEIQTQTNEVVLAMEAGTEQVVEGTQMVEETRSKLNEITSVSSTIQRLIGEITEATAVQTQAYETVSQTMEQVATIADDSSKQSDDVAKSFSRLLDVADALQVSVAQFKVS